MGQSPKDWHLEEIKAEVRKRGKTLAALSIENGYGAGVCSKALKHPWPAVERLIAAYLGVAPSSIWPSRYNRNGTPQKERSKHINSTKSLAIHHPSGRQTDGAEG